MAQRVVYWICGVLVFLGVIFVLWPRDPVPTTLGCAAYPEEVFSEVLVNEEGRLIVPVAQCWTPIVLVPKYRNFQINSDKCLNMIWEYEDGTESAAFTECPGENKYAERQARGVKFQNTGKLTNNLPVGVVITPG